MKPPKCEDPYYDRPAFSHGGFGLGACKAGAGHLPRALWVPNRLLAEHEARLQRAHHERRVRQAAPSVPLREDRASAPGRSRAFEVAVFPSEPGNQQRFCFHLDGERCPTLELVRGETYTFDQSHFSNLGDEAGRFALRFFESEEEGSSHTDGVRASVVPPGLPGAHVCITVGHSAPSVLYYRDARADSPVEGGLVFVQAAGGRARGEHAGQGARHSPAAGRAGNVAAPRRKPLDMADALAARQARMRVNAQLLARRNLRREALTQSLDAAASTRLAAGTDELRETHHQTGGERRVQWNSRSRDPRDWVGGLPTHRSNPGFD